jgi:hypothetical protein
VRAAWRTSPGGRRHPRALNAIGFGSRRNILDAAALSADASLARHEQFVLAVAVRSVGRAAV